MKARTESKKCLFNAIENETVYGSLFDGEKNEDNHRNSRVKVEYQYKDVTPWSENDPFKSFRGLKQACLFTIWITIGFYNGIMGPTLPDLRDKLGVSQQQITQVLMGRTIGFALGAIIGGFLFRIFYKLADLLMLMCILLAAVGIFIAPWANSLPTLVACFLLVGIAEGSTNAGGNTMCIALWKEKTTVPMNIQHCGFGVGSLIIPLIVKPFLSREKLTSVVNGTSEIMQITSQTPATDSRITVPYTLVGGALLLVAAIWLAFVIKGPPAGFPQWTPHGELKNMLSPASCGKGYHCYSVQLLFLLFLFYAFSGSAQRIYFEFLFSFTTEGTLQMTRSDAVLLQTVYWICYTLGRGFLGSLTLWIRVQTFLCIVCVLMTIFILCIAFFTSESVIMMWTFNCLYGLVCGLPFPNAIAWGNIYLDMNSLAVMVPMVGASCGVLTFEAWSGHVYDAYSPDTVKFLPVIAGGSLLIVFIIMQLIGHFCGKHFRQVKIDETHKLEASLSISY